MSIAHGRIEFNPFMRRESLSFFFFSEEEKNWFRLVKWHLDVSSTLCELRRTYAIVRLNTGGRVNFICICREQSVWVWSLSRLISRNNLRILYVFLNDKWVAAIGLKWHAHRSRKRAHVNGEIMRNILHFKPKMEQQNVWTKKHFRWQRRRRRCDFISF